MSSCQQSSISAQTRKMLWGFSGNRCAFPRCNARLVERDSANDRCKLGEEAHIIAQSIKGPRGNERNHPIIKDINSYDNLILLCPNHHSEIDSFPERYSVDYLIAMKKKHKRKMDKMYEQRKQSHSSGAHILNFQAIKNCIDMDYTEVFDIIPFEKSCIIVCSGEGIDKKKDRWSGTDIKIFHAQNEVCKKIYSVDGPLSFIEYWFSKTKFYVLRETCVNCQPFIKYEFNLNKFPGKQKTTLLPPINPLHVNNIPKYIKEIKNISEKEDPEHSIEKIYSLIDNIWEAGLAQPDIAINELKKLENYSWCDGAVAGDLHTILEELILVKKIKHGNP